jgi:hypothetical protein
MTVLLTQKYREETETAIEEGTWPQRTLHACFLLGSNTTCHGHIAGYHYEEYEKQCKAAKPRPVQLNYRCIPKEVMKREKARAKAAKLKQSTLGFAVVKEFTREVVLEMVTKYIVCDDQVSVKFQRCAESLTWPHW